MPKPITIQQCSTKIRALPSHHPMVLILSCIPEFVPHNAEHVPSLNCRKHKLHNKIPWDGPPKNAACLRCQIRYSENRSAYHYNPCACNRIESNKHQNRETSPSTCPGLRGLRFKEFERWIELVYPWVSKRDKRYVGGGDSVFRDSRCFRTSRTDHDSRMPHTCSNTRSSE
jgi:hypothetical protein